MRGARFHVCRAQVKVDELISKQVVQVYLIMKRFSRMCWNCSQSKYKAENLSSAKFSITSRSDKEFCSCNVSRIPPTRENVLNSKFMKACVTKFNVGEESLKSFLKTSTWILVIYRAISLLQRFPLWHWTFPELFIVCRKRLYIHNHKFNIFLINIKF